MELTEAFTAAPFTAAEGRAAGLGMALLRNPSLQTSLRGVRAAADVADNVVNACRAAMLVLPGGSCISHGTALRLHGTDLPRRLDRDTRIHATVPRGATVSRRPQLCVHSGSALPPTRQMHGMPVALAAEAWVQVSALLAVDDLVVVADALLRRTDPIETLARLEASVAACRPGTRGVGRLREALGLARAGTDSLMETRARLVLVRAGLPCPVVNVPVFGVDGTFLARPDMHYPDVKLAIEYDGDVHRTDPSTWRRDIERRQRLEDAGWVIITATADDVFRIPERLVARVARLRHDRSAL